MPLAPPAPEDEAAAPLLDEALVDVELEAPPAPVEVDVLEELVEDAELAPEDAPVVLEAVSAVLEPQAALAIATKDALMARKTLNFCMDDLCSAGSRAGRK